MYISFNSRKLERSFNAAASLRKNYGDRMARAIMKRMAVLRAARNLALVPTNPPERRHSLSGRRAGQFAVDLVHPFRLVFEPNHDPVPLTQDKGIDSVQVVAIRILAVIDYH